MLRKLVLVPLICLVMGVIPGSSLIADGDIPQPNTVHGEKANKTLMDFDPSGTVFIERVETGDMDSIKTISQTCPVYSTPSVVIQGSQCAVSPPGWVRVTGIVHLNGVPLNAMVLINGRYMFSSGATGAVGDFDLTVPLDANNSILVYGFVSGMLPYRMVFQVNPFTCQLEGCGQPGLPLYLYNLNFPGNVISGEWYDGTVDYEGTFEDIANPVMVMKFYTTSGYILTYTTPGPTASNCTIDFTVHIPNDLYGSGTDEIRLIDLDDGQTLTYNWENNAVSNTVDVPLTIY